MGKQTDNQRDFFRCDIQLPFSFSVIRDKKIIGHYHGRTLNLGGGGMFFATDCPLLQPGTLILAEFMPPEGLKLPDEVPRGDFLARVIREADEESDSRERHFLLAVEFKFLHKATRNEIVSFLNRYEVLRHKGEI